MIVSHLESLRDIVDKHIEIIKDNGFSKVNFIWWAYLLGMSLNLLNSFGVKGVSYGLYKKQADVIDTQYLSQFFVISDFNSTFTAGKNSFSFNGSTYLKSGSEIFI